MPILNPEEWDVASEGPVELWEELDYNYLDAVHAELSSILVFNRTSL